MAFTRILVADRDQVVLALVSHILRRQGYPVDSAHSAEDAGRQLAHNHHGAILIDSEFASLLTPELTSRAILMSPQPESELPVRAVLQKPVEFGLLVDTVRRILE